jgi:signal transduction histidine kinase
MKTLALRIYLTVVTVLLVFALVTGWLAQHNLEHERHQMQSQTAWNERAAAWGELIENSLPDVHQPTEEQARVFLDWAERLRMPMALANRQGEPIATSAMMEEMLQRFPDARERVQRTELSDGRVLFLLRPRLARGMGPGSVGPPPPRSRPWLEPLAWLVPPWLAEGVPALALSLVLLFVAVAVGAWPVAHRLTRRLQALRTGVEAFGSGQLQYRVAVEGKDEVADLASSFNEAAQRIEDLITSNRSLLANASHELRSPLARLKMAVSIMADMPPERAAQLKDEIHQDIRELDALVEEVLLASRLDARSHIERQGVDLLGLAIEEASRVGAQIETADDWPSQPYVGDERLLRRAVRNLLENAKRYGGPDIVLRLQKQADELQINISDRGPGVPPDQRERIFEPFYRLPGHAEHAGGVGLGLSLVRQIAQRHGGQVRCEAREGGGSRFVIALPAALVA